MSSPRLSEGFGFCAHIFHFQPFLSPSLSLFSPQSACDYVSVSPLGVFVCLSYQCEGCAASLCVCVFCPPSRLSAVERRSRGSGCAYLTTTWSGAASSWIHAPHLWFAIWHPSTSFWHLRLLSVPQPEIFSLLKGFSLEGEGAHFYAVHILKPLDLLCLSWDFEILAWPDLGTNNCSKTKSNDHTAIITIYSS